MEKYLQNQKMLIDGLLRDSNALESEACIDELVVDESKEAENDLPAPEFGEWGAQD